MNNVALVHDFLMQYGGAERVLECFHAMYPDAPVFTLLADTALLPETYKTWDIRPVSVLQGAPWLRAKYKAFFPVYPSTIERIDLRGYDLVISSSYAYAHGAPVTEDACHISYCHTPMRFVWFQEEQYKQNVPAFAAPIYSAAIRKLRKWDQAAAQRPYHYIANGLRMARRITQAYGRTPSVVHPPCFLSHEAQGPRGHGDYYLVVARLVYPYKRVDLAIEAAKRLGRKLKIAGDGGDRAMFEGLADHNIEFLGQLDDAGLAEAYRGCKALLMPWDEDFGIVPIEANAFGKPVITYRDSGATESQVEDLTAIFFDTLTTESLVAAMRRFEERTWDADAICNSALQFSPQSFQAKMNQIIEQCTARFSAAPGLPYRHMELPEERRAA